MANDAFQNFVNKELPTRVSTQIPEKGNLGKGLMPFSTGVGLEVEFLNFDQAIPKLKSVVTANNLEKMTGLSRWYPTDDIKIFSVRAYCGTVSEGADIIAALNVDGSQILQITIPAGDNFIELPSLDLIILKSSYLTLDILQIGTVHAGSDLVVELFHKVKA